ncbi:MAG: hypothetical protein FJ271_26295 [Planctomycetes bacterium]|nr:hypothetical protein [Planctomycetota bacterium]
MKSKITAVAWGFIAVAWTSATAAYAQPDNKLPVLKPKEIRHINPNWSGTSGVAFCPDGTRVVVAANGGYGPNGSFAVWEVETGKRMLWVNADPVDNAQAAAWLNSIAYSPDGKLIVTGGKRAWAKREERGRAFVALFDSQTGERIRILEKPSPSAVGSVAFSPDSKRIVIAGGNSHTADGSPPVRIQFLTVWDVDTGKELLDLKGLKFSVSGAKFSGNGKRIVASSVSGPASAVRLWDAETGKELLALKDLGDDDIRSFAINRDGTRIVTGGEADGRVVTVRLWDADTGKEFRTFGKVPLRRVAFHPNGKWIVGVTGGGHGVVAGTVKIWDIATGREVASFVARRDTPIGMDISADGKRIAVCFNHGQTSVWSLETEP